MAQISLYTTVTQEKTSDQGHAYDLSVNVYLTLDDEGNLERGHEIASFADHSGEADPDQRTWRGANHYLCFVELPEEEPTEAQRAWMATRYLDKGLLDLSSVDGRKPNNQVCGWAFAGLTPQDISDSYGDGRTVYLAGGPGT